MKKLVCILLAACLMTAALAGCGGKKRMMRHPVRPPLPHRSPRKSLCQRWQRRPKPCGLRRIPVWNIRAEASTDSEILGLARMGERLALLVGGPSKRLVSDPV